MDAEHAVRERLADAFWERHANPMSGWTRLLIAPLLALACYRRDRRLAALALALSMGCSAGSRRSTGATTRGAGRVERPLVVGLSDR